MGTDMVGIDADGELTTTSVVIAQGTEVEHPSVIRLIRNYVADLEEFGRVGFEIAPFATSGGLQRREIAVLNEAQATLLMTYMRNTDVVRAFKKRLVRAFLEMRKLVQESRVALPDRRELALMVIEAEDRADREAEGRRQAESWAKQLEPFAATQLALAEADGDYGVADAAKVLSRDPNIEIGEHRLFSFMAEIKWVYRESGRWRPYQTAIKSGVLAMLQEGKPFWHEGKQKMMLSVPPVRVTGDGLGVLHRKLGGHAESPRIVEGPK